MAPLGDRSIASTPGWHSLRRAADRARAAFRRLSRDRRGVAAIEFALVVPVLIVLYVGALEISVGMTVNTKVTRAAITIADLVAQRTETATKSQLSTMVDVAESVLAPYGGSPLQLKIASIKVDSTGNGKVQWSWDQDNHRPFNPGSTIAIPDDLKIAGAVLIRTELEYDHSLLLFLPGAMDSEVRTVTLGKTYFTRQRTGDGLACSDC